MKKPILSPSTAPKILNAFDSNKYKKINSKLQKIIVVNTAVEAYRISSFSEKIVFSLLKIYFLST